jgi:hypothetical protein
LIVGGRDDGEPVADVSFYNYNTNQWFTFLNNIPNPRFGHSAVLLPDGRVVVIGGRGGPGVGYLNDIKIFHPGENSWFNGGELAAARAYHDTILTPNGNLLTVGGLKSDTVAQSSIVSYPESYAFPHTLTPTQNNYAAYLRSTIDQASFTPTGVLSLSGSGFIPPAEASGGLTNQSATNFPLVQAIRLDNQQVQWFYPEGNPTNTGFLSKSYPNLPQGAYLVFVHTNGAQSKGKIVFLSGFDYTVYLPALMK